MVVERSKRRCLLCDRYFDGRAFVCRECAARYRGRPVPVEVLRRFYHAVDVEYPDWASTYGNYNPPRMLLKCMESMDRTSRVLEIGAGGGHILESLWQMGFHRLTGSDITTSALREMDCRKAEITVVGADAESLPFHNHSFDIVISSDVIEHLPQVRMHLSEVHRILAPGGSYLIKTPNRLMAETYYRIRGLYDYFIWHPSMFTPGEMRSILEAYGFKATIMPVNELTAAQLRKVPTRAGRILAEHTPVRWLPDWLRPHLEVAARRAH